jgi:hypothetical protein
VEEPSTQNSARRKIRFIYFDDRKVDVLIKRFHLPESFLANVSPGHLAWSRELSASRPAHHFMYISLGHGHLSPGHDTSQYTLQNTSPPAPNCLQRKPTRDFCSSRPQLPPTLLHRWYLLLCPIASCLLPCHEASAPYHGACRSGTLGILAASHA